MYNREHVTMYLLSPELVVGFRVQVHPPVTRVVQIVSFFHRDITLFPSSEWTSRQGGTGNDTGSGTFEAQYETKDTCFGCKSRGNGWLGSLYDAPRFLVDFSFSRHASRREFLVSSTFRRDRSGEYISEFFNEKYCTERDSRRCNNSRSLRRRGGKKVSLTNDRWPLPSLFKVTSFFRL